MDASPAPAPRATPAPAAREDAFRADAPLDADVVDAPPLHMGPAGPPPAAQQIAAAAAAAGGLFQVLMGATLGSLLVSLGVVWLAGAIGLFGDRRWGWFAALAGYLGNGIVMLAYATAYAPIVPAVVPVVGGIGALALGGVLLLPGLRDRWAPRRALV
ncbi:MAG: hypothetical protein H6704_26205 [Myxococcales bacterium]|nr:hypothetical protein [Myxococcales bacterium]